MAGIEDVASTSDTTESSSTGNSSSDTQVISILDRLREPSLFCQIALLTTKCDLLKIMLKHLSCYFSAVFFVHMDSYMTV